MSVRKQLIESIVHYLSRVKMHIIIKNKHKTENLYQ